MKSVNYLQSIQKKYFKAACLLGCLGVIAMIVMLMFGERFVLASGDASTLAQWVTFGGAFHPVLLHLPIGIVAVVLLLEFGQVLSMGRYRPRTTLPLFLAVISSLLASIFGYLLYLTGDFVSEVVEEHKRDGALFTIFIIITYLIKYKYDLRRVERSQGGLWVVYLLSLIMSTLMMIAAGHHGGVITHGDPMDKAPWNVAVKKPVAEESLEIDDFVVFTSVIQPILTDKCISCHGGKKKKGGLRMDSYEALIEGGEETDCLILGDLEGSGMISYLHLPLDDDRRMPPEDKPQLTEDEIVLLEWWVKSGASETALVSSLEATVEEKHALKRYVK